MQAVVLERQRMVVPFDWLDIRTVGKDTADTFADTVDSTVDTEVDFVDKHLHTVVSIAVGIVVGNVVDTAEDTAEDTDLGIVGTVADVAAAGSDRQLHFE